MTKPPFSGIWQTNVTEQDAAILQLDVEKIVKDLSLQLNWKLAFIQHFS